MSEWQRVKFEDLLVGKKISYGVVQPGQFQEVGGVPLIRVNNIKNAKVDVSDIVKIHEDVEAKYAKTRLSGGELLITVVGSVGECAIVTEDLKGFNVARAVSVANIIDGVDKRFVAYQFRTEDLKFQMYGNTNDTVQPTLNLTELKQLTFTLPPLPEQKAIASVLSSLDDKIDLLHRQNKTLEAMAETLFRQWFIEEAKEDWVNVQLKDIVKQIKPGTNYQPKRLDSGIPFLNVRNLQNGQINLQGISFISQEEYERVHKAWKPEEGDVLISRIGTLGIVAVLGKRDMPMAVHYNMLVLKPSLTNTAFLYFLLRSQYFQEAYSSKARQSVQEYVAVEDAESIELKLPLNDAAFANKQDEFYCLFDKIRANLYQIQTLENLRDTLLPKLMSGEVRVQYQTEEVA